ncbi:DUF7669 domain-containing protein [Paenibacillus crassostreae]|uniref:DUF7669 domain-containing protein n=2 Tax=Paenibacillus crassostreae TaxID=1763538 RepID=A0A167EJL0_9BACL|nr:hypothetical protein [Paenibacillus crassostreae]AOZ94924.1 hypothetical protein LPB68_21935 [Paenibacillus crassostreae]OAB75606.1 hypothetical protein PNBC_08225 [Paenibacillus crassostreae]
MSEVIDMRSNYRDEILAVVHEIVKRKRINEFKVVEVVDHMLNMNPNLKASTIRTHLTSRCCVNANANHAVTYNDYERIKRGVYRLYERESKKLYFVDVNVENNSLLALDFEMNQEEDGRVGVSFFDTNRGRGFLGKVLVQEDDGFVFLTEQGDVMTFRVATVEEYDLIWRRSVEGNVRSFRSDEELHKWYNDRFLGE